MATTDKDQMSEFVPQHKRIAMGVPLTGSSMQPKGQQQPAKPKGGALSQAKKK
jgi:hypothetical protein